MLQINKKQFWNKVKELREQYIENQEYLSGSQYSSLRFRTSLDTLWDTYVRFAVINKPSDRTIPEWALIMSRARELANYNTEIKMENMTIYDFINRNLISHISVAN